MKEKGRKILDFIVKNGKLIFPVIVCFAVAVTVVIALKAANVRVNELEQIGEPVSTSESIPEPSQSADPLCGSGQDPFSGGETPLGRIPDADPKHRKAADDDL